MKVGVRPAIFAILSQRFRYACLMLAASLLISPFSPHLEPRGVIPLTKNRKNRKPDPDFEISINASDTPVWC